MAIALCAQPLGVVVALPVPPVCLLLLLLLLFWLIIILFLLLFLFFLQSLRDLGTKNLDVHLELSTFLGHRPWVPREDGNEGMGDIISTSRVQAPRGQLLESSFARLRGPEGCL